jgi:phospholipase C
MHARSRILVLALAALGCTSNPAPTDAGGTSDTGADGSAIDTGAADVGTDAGGGDVGTDSGPPPVDANVDAFAYADGGPGVDPHWGERLGCAFSAGAMPADTLGDLTAARSSIQNVIVIMQENRSVDHMFGMTGHGIEGIPAGWTVPDRMGAPVAPFHETTACPADIPHQWNQIHGEWNMGAMDGFVRQDGVGAMGYFTDDDHPFYTWMITTFATSDRYFCSVLSGTYPNRDYLYGGTSQGIMSTLAMYPTGPLVFDQLDAAHVPWAEYNASTVETFSGSLGWPVTHAGVHLYSEFLPALDGGTLPPVSFVDLDPNDEHPPNSIHDGEIAVREIMMHAMASPQWAHMAIFFTYDENGGFLDHVPPPTACLADPTQTAFDHLGMRVPVAVVSPYARAGFVSHDVHSHTSILRFIQAIFDLPALTGRDANSDAMLDMFDFASAPFATPPAAASVPAAAPPGC